MANLKDLESNANYSFVKGDICDRNLVDKTMEGADMVAHFAAETHVDRSILDPDAFLKTNINGTYTLLEAARKFDLERYSWIFPFL